MVESLLYLALATRLDILPSALTLARCQNAPRAYFHRDVRRVLRCLRGTSPHSLLYKPGSLDFNAFVDSEFAGNSTDCKSTSGFMVKLGLATCFFGNRKQVCIALSTGEAEYYALTMATQEIMGVSGVLTECGFVAHEAVSVRSESECAVGYATAERYLSGRAKHIEVKVQFIRNLVKHNLKGVDHVPSERNDADIFTTPLSSASVIAIAKHIGLAQKLEEEC